VPSYTKSNPLPHGRSWLRQLPCLLGSRPPHAHRPDPFDCALAHRNLLWALVALLFWRPFIGEVPVPTGSIFGWPPWNAHVPADFHGVKNALLGDVTFQMVPWALARLGEAFPS
jgi:hypothetical protein